MKSITGLKYILSLSGLGILVLTFQNCSGEGGFSTIDQASEVSLFSVRKVFAAENSGTIPLAGNNPTDEFYYPTGGLGVVVGSSGSGSSGSSGGGSNSNGSNGSGNVPVVVGIGDSEAGTGTVGVVGAVDSVINLNYLCSDNYSAKKSNLASQSSVRVAIFKDGTSKSCVYDDANLKSIIKAHKTLPLNAISAGVKANCAGMPDGDYTLSISAAAKSPAGTKTGLLVQAAGIVQGLGAVSLLDRQAVKVTNGFVGRTTTTATVAKILNDVNTQKHLEPATKCDYSQSPLLIQFDANNGNFESLKLTSQADGINFDIMGENAEPVAHTPMRISWHRSNNYLFLTLPDANGQVNGINEMFGDNTRGPDGEFSNDGFAALAKYDGMSVDGKTRVAPADGYINSDDPIFSKLRAWRDSGFDGIAQNSDLIPLKDLGITVIDLQYDAHYREVDVNGNEVRYKSAAKSRDGRLHLVFDLWFKTL